MLPRITLISCAALVLLMAHTSHAAPVVQKRGFGDIEQVCDDDALTGFGDSGDLADELDADDFNDFSKRDEDHVVGAGGHAGPVHAGGGAVNSPDGGDIGDGELFGFVQDLFTKRDGDDIVHGGAGIGLGEKTTKRDGDGIINGGAGIGVGGSFIKRDGDGIVNGGAGIGVGDD
ncbi:hypothetical protein LRAMOSA09050 [Lichtheimia ramosa]|uniref:Uncharacterized protein n=1 Tax=Lichtheimia ramosa TaxID=688394 RepID=A0A077WIV3_9FUNG|nr:hypothetical protein LRAMOSA09050 [Lichtheimia ramosa]